MPVFLVLCLACRATLSAKHPPYDENVSALPDLPSLPKLALSEGQTVSLVRMRVDEQSCRAPAYVLSMLTVLSAPSLPDLSVVSVPVVSVVSVPSGCGPLLQGTVPKRTKHTDTSPKQPRTLVS